MTLQELEKKGVDPIDLMKKVNLSYLITDVLDTLATDIMQDFKKAGLLREQFKRDAKRLKKLTSTIVQQADKAISDDNTSEHFSDDSDYIYEVLMLLTEKKNHVQVLSTLKMIK